MNTESRIRVLPDLLVKKIAAGEVVERPASVVKELVENSLDAGASRIAITIEDGGRQLVRVTDDGCGMSAEEMKLAILPHATSKIRAEEDLFAIETMGFRGEALASISSVSRLRIVSRLSDSDAGYEIRVAGNQVESHQAAGCPPGTTIEVRDLFFNVPVRRKFLKTPSTEVGHINEQLARIALAHPGMGFELINNQRVTQSLPPATDRKERITRWYGEELAAALLHVDREERGVHLEAYLAPPVHSRATGQWQYTFVNGRYVRDRFIQHAVREAYRGLMEPNRHAVVYLFITIDTREVDVNVHPTKIEVRWADSGLIHSQVLSALRETLQRADLTPALRTDRSGASHQTGAPQLSKAEIERMQRELAEAMKAATPIKLSPQSSTGGAFPSSSGAFSNSGSTDARSLPQGYGDPMEIWRALYGPPPHSDAPQHSDPSGSPSPNFFKSPSDALSGSYPYSSESPGDYGEDPAARGFADDGYRTEPSSAPRAIQMHNLYLVVETEEGIVIIDQHALHERVMYEQLRERFTDGPLESQRLLLPETVRVTPHQAALLENHSDLLAKLGIDLTSFGSDSVAIHTFPVLLKDTDVPGFMHDLLDKLDQQAGRTERETEAVIHELLDMMACKAAVKAGDPLSQEEIRSLVEKRHLIEKSASCPHGRPTMLRLTRADLNRQFHRT